MRVADFFCGGGGFSEGFRQAGFNIVFAVDKWEPAITTYKGNKPGVNAILDDVIRISNLPDDEFEALVPDSEVIIGSPPCQSFSHSNKSGNADKSIGIQLIEAYLKIIARKKYKKNSILKYWVLENVPNQLRDITAVGDQARVERLINNISPYFIRIRKSDLNIPPATINPPIVVPMGEYQRRIYDFIEKKYMDAMMGEGEPDLSSKFKAALAQARMIRLMQAASDPAMLRTPLFEFMEDDECPAEAYQAVDDADLLKSIMEYEAIETPSKYLAVERLVNQITKDGGKVVIWATFIHTIHGIKEYLESKGIRCQELYGAIPVEKEGANDDSEEQILTREKIVRAFQSEDCPFKVIIANPFAVAESISLHKACHNAIYLERSFNAAHFVQSKDRIHRYGLKAGTKTNYYYILSEDSIDETIDIRLAEKEQRMTEIMESMPIPLFNNVSDDLGNEDIKALIKDYVRRTKKA